MSSEERRTKVLLIEDDAPLMRTMAWALTENGFDVQVVSKRQALEMHGLEGPDVAVFNMKGTAEEKLAYIHQLRMLNPDCVIIDVDEFEHDVHESIRDSAADSYVDRPANLDTITKIIRELTAKSTEERSDMREARERELRGEPEDAP